MDVFITLVVVKVSWVICVDFNPSNHVFKEEEVYYMTVTVH